MDNAERVNKPILNQINLVCADVGASVAFEPYDAIWGARYAVIEDPDGLAVGLMSAVSPDKKSPPPDL